MCNTSTYQMGNVVSCYGKTAGSWGNSWNPIGGDRVGMGVTTDKTKSGIICEVTTSAGISHKWLIRFK